MQALKATWAARAQGPEGENMVKLEQRKSRFWFTAAFTLSAGLGAVALVVFRPNLTPAAVLIATSFFTLSAVALWVSNVYMRSAYFGMIAGFLTLTCVSTIVLPPFHNYTRYHLPADRSVAFKNWYLIDDQAAVYNFDYRILGDDFYSVGPGTPLGAFSDSAIDEVFRKTEKFLWGQQNLLDHSRVFFKRHRSLALSETDLQKISRVVAIRECMSYVQFSVDGRSVSQMNKVCDVERYRR